MSRGKVLQEADLATETKLSKEEEDGQAENE